MLNKMNDNSTRSKIIQKLKPEPYNSIKSSSCSKSKNVTSGAKLSMKIPDSPTTFTFSKSTLEKPEQCVKSV